MNSGIWRFSKWLDPVPTSARMTLGEGNTPIVRSRRLGPSVGLKNLFFKLELTNPSGSYKDRFACAAISDMVAGGKTECIAMSSGNTGAALAAYCALAGISCEIAIVEGAPDGKLKQMLAYSARLFRVRGFGIDSRLSEQVVECLKILSARPQAQMQISAFAYSPVGMSGVKSLSHELAEQATAIDRTAWDHVFCMAGGGGLTLAVSLGFEQLHDAGELLSLPRVDETEGPDIWSRITLSGKLSHVWLAKKASLRNQQALPPSRVRYRQRKKDISIQPPTSSA